MVSSVRQKTGTAPWQSVADMNSRSHVQSESHVRQVLLIGEDPKRHIEDFSRLFLNNFLNLLKTTHGEKKVHINQFYQQVIADKEVSFLVGGMVVVADINSTFT